MPEQQEILKQKISAKLGEQVVLTEPLAWKDFGLCIEVQKEKAHQVFKTLKEDGDFAFDMLIDVTCVDWLEEREERFEVVYQLLSLEHQSRLCVKIRVHEDKPEVDSVVDLWKSANFMEREAWDMYGVSFAEHGDLRRILMYDEFEGHPLRKDYPILKKQPRIELRVPELHNTSKDMKREQLVSLPVRQHKKASAN
jgi:NADH-quinone oxidoreductase subunit C